VNTAINAAGNAAENNFVPVLVAGAVIAIPRQQHKQKNRSKERFFLTLKLLVHAVEEISV
jgi:hypothetical protein